MMRPQYFGWPWSRYRRAMLACSTTYRCIRLPSMSAYASCPDGSGNLISMSSSLACDIPLGDGWRGGSAEPVDCALCARPVSTIAMKQAASDDSQAIVRRMFVS